MIDEKTTEQTRPLGDTNPGDPYGWIAAVERHPNPQEWSVSDPEGTNAPDGEPVPATVEQPPVSTGPYAVVTLTDSLAKPDRFDGAVATVLPNGTLLVALPGRNVPLKGYAPGVWYTFEHVGPEYQQKPRPFQAVQEDSVRQQNRAPYIPQDLADRSAFTTDDVLTSPQRRQAPTLDQDADADTADTKSFEQITDERAGVVQQAPKARGVREDAASTGPTTRPGTDTPVDDGPRPGRLKSLWQSLTAPGWSED